MTSEIQRSRLSAITRQLSKIGENRLAIALIWNNYKIQRLNIAKMKHNQKVEKLERESKELYDIVMIKLTKIPL